MGLGGPARGDGEYQAFLSDFADAVAQHVAGPPPPAGPSPALTRARFEIGSSNELAVRAADALVSDPGGRINPLLIHGPSGVGKTHLLHAIGNALLARAKGRAVVCVGAQALIDELRGAERDGGVERWRSRYRGAGALLVDDVQALDVHDRARELFVDVAAEAHAVGKQIVLIIDRPPALSKVGESLRSRFAGAVVAEIEPPDRELREKILRRLMNAAGADPHPDVAGYLADVPATSARDLHGLVTRLRAAASAAGVPLSLDFARAELEGARAGRAAPAGGWVADTAIDAFFLDGERIIWEWPDAAGRAIEEWG